MVQRIHASLHVHQCIHNENMEDQKNEFHKKGFDKQSQVNFELYDVTH